MNALADAVKDVRATGTPTTSVLMAPSLALSSCVRAYITRSTVGAVLRSDQRHNHFPASPLCGIFWLLEGESLIVRRGEELVNEPVPRLSFAGPHTVPMVSVNPGPVRAFMLGLLPQAFQALTGLDLPALVNRVVPVDAVLDSPWQAMAQAVQDAPDDLARVQVIEAFLEPRWGALCHQAVSRPQRYRHWAETLALRAGTSGVGKSLRQAERRIKQWVGLPMRELRRLGRAEESFFMVRKGHLADPYSESSAPAPDWAAIAVDSGYSDQAHLCREVRRVAGLSPKELKRAIDEDESFWTYRIWS
ncbi:helix-turn-helix domain-containing protein [Rhodoferax sp.]|uniref:helix-turn-helix domain-containing protein n=1 Tax=Rhodoferax sp. TaxID=50421 RepID=UPI0027703D3E|nr:helix-turn-helix domain-containing protein [Rhodoferax sp.]